MLSLVLLTPDETGTSIWPDGDEPQPAPDLPWSRPAAAGESEP